MPNSIRVRMASLFNNSLYKYFSKVSVIILKIEISRLSPVNPKKIFNLGAKLRYRF